MHLYACMRVCVCVSVFVCVCVCESVCVLYMSVEVCVRESMFVGAENRSEITEKSAKNRHLQLTFREK